MKSSKFTSTPLFPRQALVALLLPLIAEQALSVTIGLADTLMVSSVGEAAVSGVSLVDSFNTLMIQIMSALATGGAVVTSQYIGHQEPKNAKAAAAQILFVLSSFSVLVAAVVSSFDSRGNGSMYLGSAGVTSMLIGICALVLAVKSLGEENSFKLFPYLSTLCSLLITGIWVALYVIGFLA